MQVCVCACTKYVQLPLDLLSTRLTLYYRVVNMKTSVYKVCVCVGGGNSRVDGVLSAVKVLGS